MSSRPTIAAPALSAPALPVALGKNRATAETLPAMPAVSPEALPEPQQTTRSMAVWQTPPGAREQVIVTALFSSRGHIVSADGFCLRYKSESHARRAAALIFVGMTEGV